MTNLVAAQAADPKLVAAGKDTFAKKMCTTCHMAEGKGNKNLPLDDVGAKLKAPDIKKWITEPAEMTKTLKTKPAIPMPKVALTDAEVNGLVAYLSTLKTPAK